MNKLKYYVSIIWIIIALVCVFLGMDTMISWCLKGGVFEKIASSGFLASLFTIGTVFIVVSINSAETDIQKERILKEAKEIYSLDYSKLKNIKKIELNIEHEYFVVLKKDSNNFEFRLADNKIPHTQSELELLDERFEDAGIKIKKEEMN